MKVAIVGTSNSLLTDGYVVGMRDSGIFEAIDNYSIGISTGIFSVHSTQSVDFADYDFGIIDFAVNEQIFHQCGWTNFREMEDTFVSLTGRMLEAGCIPVPLLIPRRSTIAESRACDFYVALAERFGLPHFDVRAVMRRLAAEAPFDTRDAYRDEAHPGPAFAQAIGNALAVHLKTFAGREFPRQEGSLPRLVAFDITPLAPDSLARAERATSLTRQRFVAVSPEPWAVALPPEAVVVGVAVNLNASDTVLKVEGDRTCFLDLRSNESGNRVRAFTFSVGYIPTPVHAKDGGVRLSTVTVASLSEAEAAELKATVPSGYPTWDGTGVEVAALILRLPEPVPTSRKAPLGIAGDLAEAASLQPFRDALPSSQAITSPALWSGGKTG